MRTIYASYVEHKSGGQVCDGDENEKWPNYEPVETDFELKQVSLHKSQNWYYESIDTDFDVTSGDTVYILVARYSSGDTFGRTNGLFSFIGAYQTKEELNKVVSDLYEENKIYSDRSNKNRKKLPYRPWHGYFEYLEGFETYRAVVDGSLYRSN